MSATRNMLMEWRGLGEGQREIVLRALAETTAHGWACGTEGWQCEFCVAMRTLRAAAEPEAWTQEEIDASEARAKQTAAELGWAAKPEAHPSSYSETDVANAALKLTAEAKAQYTDTGPGEFGPMVAANRRALGLPPQRFPANEPAWRERCLAVAAVLRDLANHEALACVTEPPCGSCAACRAHAVLVDEERQ